MDNLQNLLILSDSYKLTHHVMYPTDTEYVYSYFESRDGGFYPETVFFGLQAVLMKYLVGQVVTEEKLSFANRLSAAHFGNGHLFNESGWRYILENHNGYLPLRIRAVPEGLSIPLSNVMMTVENTDPSVPWLTNYVESLLTHVWSPCTVATKSRAIKKLLFSYLNESGASLDVLPFMLHDFGFRGANCVESASLNGAAHLVNFQGTDTVSAIVCAMNYYDADVCGFSIPATEHSVMTALGPDGEEEVVRSLLEEFHGGLLAIVGDSYDIFNFAKEILGGIFRERILAREGVLILRPDSGDPVTTIMELLRIFEDKFGSMENAAGYNVLNPKVRLIWGDGVDFPEIDRILEVMLLNYWSAENICFGMGGALHQKVNRDTQRNAFKSSAQCRSGVWHDIWKDPLDKSKSSKRGRLALMRDDSGYQTVREEDCPVGKDILELVFENGALLRHMNFDEVRKNAEIGVR